MNDTNWVNRERVWGSEICHDATLGSFYLKSQKLSEPCQGIEDPDFPTDSKDFRKLLSRISTQTILLKKDLSRGNLEFRLL